MQKRSKTPIGIPKKIETEFESLFGLDFICRSGDYVILIFYHSMLLVCHSVETRFVLAKSLAPLRGTCGAGPFFDKNI